MTTTPLPRLRFSRDFVHHRCSFSLFFLEITDTLPPLGAAVLRRLHSVRFSRLGGGYRLFGKTAQAL